MNTTSIPEDIKIRAEVIGLVMMYRLYNDMEEAVDMACAKVAERTGLTVDEVWEMAR